MENGAKASAYDKEEDQEIFSYTMQLISGASLPMVLHAAVKLQVFEIIAKAGTGAKLSASHIASQTPSKNPGAATMLDRMLRLLASYSVLTCSLGEGDERVYGLAPASKYFVPDEDGISLGPLLALLQDKVLMNSWYELADAVLEGGVPFNRAHGVHAFLYPGMDPRFNELFNKGMFSPTTIIMRKILQQYKGFEQLQSQTLVDVGGGVGITLQMIVAQYPSIKGINFDLPHVVQQGPTIPGVEHVGGDMFESVPSGDVIFMKWILHDWSDDMCLKLLKNCYKALPDNGKAIVVDMILPLTPDTSAYAKGTCQSDVLMMTQNPGGKERNEKEFLALATEAGFKGMRKECFVSNLWIMEFYK